MRIAIVGDWTFEIYEQALATALERLGHSVVPVPLLRHFGSPDPDTGRLQAVYRAQHSYAVGPAVARANATLRRLLASERPDAALIWTRLVTPDSLRAIRRTAPGTLIACYANDDPLSPLQSAWRWRHFMAGLPLVDLALAYRPLNLDDFRRAGARRVELWPAWYDADIHRPLDLSEGERSRFECDVVFVGHYEPDGRLQVLEALAASGLAVRLFGTGWDEVIADGSPLAAQAPVAAVRGRDYAAALCGAKVALSFLSKLNRDVYTRRSFEIPATGTMMLSEHSPYLERLFVEGREAEYFRGVDEAVGKAWAYCADASRRRAVAAAGRRRVRAGGHDAVSRARRLAAWFDALRHQRPTPERVS